jgi:hypothetical protein
VIFMARTDLAVTVPDLTGRLAVVTGANSGLGASDSPPVCRPQAPTW